MFYKKSLLNKIFLFMFVFSIFLVFNIENSNAYNSSYSNITIDPDWWCAGLPATIKIYNSSEYDIRKSIEDDLCGVNETPEDDNCKEFSKIEGDFKIHAGPLDAMPVIIEGKIENNEINFTLDDVNMYLLEILPYGEYNDLEIIFNTVECEADNINKNLFNFSYSQILSSKYEVTLDITGLEYQAPPIKIDFLGENLPPNINPEIKDRIIGYFSFSVLIDKVNFEKYDLKLDFKNLKEKNPEFYIFDLKNLDKLNIFNSKKLEYKKINDSSILISNLKEKEDTYYVFVLKSNDPILNNNVNNNLNSSSNNLSIENKSIENQQEEKLAEKKTDPKPVVTNTKKPNTTLLVVAGVLIIVLIAFGIFKVVSSSKSEPIETHHTEPKLDNYTKIYNLTKEYVKKYKSSFTKDQIYRGLKLGNIPEDIIDKVLEEEFESD